MSDISIVAVEGVGMVTLRGEISMLSEAAGMRAPAQRMSMVSEGCRLNWMSPDELMMICSHSDVANRIADLRRALAGKFATLADVSDARAVFDVSGHGVEDMLAHLMPVDFGRLDRNEVRRTRMAQIPAALWREGTGWRIVCFRSVAGYAADLLAEAARAVSPAGG